MYFRHWYKTAAVSFTGSTNTGSKPALTALKYFSRFIHFDGPSFSIFGEVFPMPVWRFRDRECDYNALWGFWAVHNKMNSIECRNQESCIAAHTTILSSWIFFQLQRLLNIYMLRLHCNTHPASFTVGQELVFFLRVEDESVRREGDGQPLERETFVCADKQHLIPFICWWTYQHYLESEKDRAEGSKENCLEVKWSMGNFNV